MRRLTGTLAPSREELIKRAFKQRYEKLHLAPLILGLKVIEAPAAECWVVIVNGSIAWVARSDEEEFVFWSRGKTAIIFSVPGGW